MVRARTQTVFYNNVHCSLMNHLNMHIVCRPWICVCLCLYVMPNHRKCNYNQSKLDIWMMSTGNVNMQTLNWIEAARVLICYSQCSLLNLNAYTNTFIQLTGQSERMMRLRFEPLCIVTGQAKCVYVSVCYLEVTGEEELNNNICYLSVALLSSTGARAHAKKEGEGDKHK